MIADGLPSSGGAILPLVLLVLLGLAEHQPLATHAGKAGVGAGTVRVLAGVVLVVDLREVQAQVLAADVVVRAVDAALGVPEEAFGRVRRRLAARVLVVPAVFLGLVVHGVV